MQFSWKSNCNLHESLVMYLPFGTWNLRLLWPVRQSECGQQHGKLTHTQICQQSRLRLSVRFSKPMIKGITHDIKMTIPGLPEVLLLGYLKEWTMFMQRSQVKMPKFVTEEWRKNQSWRSHRRSYCIQLRCYKDVSWEVSNSHPKVSNN